MFSPTQETCRAGARGFGVAGVPVSGYGLGVPPALGPSIGLALRALRRQGWLVAAGLGVAGLRRLLKAPVLAVTWAMLARAAFLAARAAPLDPLAPVQGVLAALTSPRLLALVAGLWGAAALSGALLGAAFLAGAAPALAGAMSPEPAPGAPAGTARFAEGIAYGLPRVLATALLGLAAELSGALFAVALGMGALRVTEAAAGGAGSPWLAAPVALALTLAVAVPLALSTAVDAAVARSAVLGDGPLAAFAAATRRFVSRPGAFLLGAIAFGLAGLVATAAVEAIGGVTLGFAEQAPALLRAGPTLMLSGLVLLAAVAVDLAWLGTVSVLACGEERGA